MKTYIITLSQKPKHRSLEKNFIIVKSKHSNLKSARLYAKELQKQDNWDRVSVTEPRREYTGLSYSTLQSLLDQLKENGVTDFSKVEFETDYSSCYYEGDIPGIMAVDRS